MPGLATDSSNAIVPLAPEAHAAVVYPLHHGLKPRISRLSVSWSRGNSLRVTVFREPPTDPGGSDEEAGGKVVEVKFGVAHKDVDDAQWRRIAYGSVSPFALLQSRRNSIMELSKMSMSSSPYHSDWYLS